MPDKEHDDNLEEELRDLRPRIEYPPTPDVARAVRRRLDAETSRRGGPNIWSRMLSGPGWAAAAAVAILISLIAFSPAMRSTVSDSASSFGSSGGGGGGAAGGVAEEDASAGDPSAPSSEYAVEESVGPGRQGASGGGGASAAGAGMPPGGTLGLGERLSTPEARARVGDLLVPGEVLGELAVGSEDYVCAEDGVMCAAGGASEGDGVVLVFRPGRGLAPLGNTDVGLVLVETPGGMDGAYDDLPARRASGARPEEVAVGGGRGFWFPDGRLLRPQPGEVGSLPGGALLWEKGDVALLMRADVTKEEAVRIAETVR